MWQPLQTGLPVTPVHGISVKNDDLVIGTHGRSFYVMPNIGVLRQVSRETTNEPVVLFDPADAMRSVSRSVAIDYFLKQAADKVTIEILDARGQDDQDVHRHARAAGRPRRPGRRRRRGRRRGRWRRPRRAAGRASASQQGMNRFSWDLRYPDARDFPGIDHVGRQHARPGRAAGPLQGQADARTGVSKTQEFAIVRNANVPRVTDQDLIEQFTLAKQINDKVTVANDAVLRIRGLKEQIAARIEASTDARLKTAGEALTEKLTAVEGEIYQYRNRSNQDPLNYPDPAEQQARGAAGHRRERRRQADRSVVRGVQGAVGAARQGTGAARRAREDRSARLQFLLTELKLEPIMDGVPQTGTQ